MATAVRHETRALLRAHLSAVAGRGHLTRRCPVCHRLRRLAMTQPEVAGGGPVGTPEQAAGGDSNGFLRPEKA